MSQIIIKPQNCPKVKKTSNFMTKYEYAKVLSARIVELNNGRPPRVYTEGMYDNYEIAKKELFEGVIPWGIRRVLHDGTYEDWDIVEMNIMEY